MVRSSYDLTPKQVDELQKLYNMPNIVDNLKIKIGEEETMDAYTDEQKELSHRYPKLGMFGFDMLQMCQELGVFSTDRGKAVIQKVEDYFNGIDIEDKELADSAQRWYEGTFCPGYYMNDNNSEFAQYLKSLTKERFISRDI